MSTGGYTMTIRCEIVKRAGMLGKVTTAIDTAHGEIGGVDLVHGDSETAVRDITVMVQNAEHGNHVVANIAAIDGVTVVHAADLIFQAHQGGKIAIQSRIPLRNRADLSVAYTPGVARVCTAIAEDPARVYELTIKRNSVAVVTDGSAVLGLGNLGAEASLPVMEGKAMLFKEFANIDAYPIAIRSQDPQTIIETVEQIAAGFGGINLEDIAAPKCFEIEEHLKRTLGIPVMHDDQHGTAVVTMAALWNALALVGKRMQDIRVVVNGVGAAGTAIIHSLLDADVGEIIACDSRGIIHRNDASLNSIKQHIAAQTNGDNLRGGLDTAMRGADVFIGVSVANILTPAMIQSMSTDPIVFAMANPTPEGAPEMLSQYARVVATGRSDYPNQINNVLAFPGIFRGALDAQAREITPGMRLAAAKAIATTIPPDAVSADYIVPSVFNRDVVPHVAAAVAEAAIAEGVIREDALALVV